MKSYVEFRSEMFPPYEGEYNEINPGRYGKRLAEFLVKGLRKRQYEAEEPVAEDWGWMIPIRNEEFGLWVGCGNYEEYTNGFLCFIEPHKSFIRKQPFFKRVSTELITGRLRDSIDELLSQQKEIQGVQWSTHEEFNQQSS